jgi:hypothetical protein
MRQLYKQDPGGVRPLGRKYYAPIQSQRKEEPTPTATPRVPVDRDAADALSDTTMAYGEYLRKGLNMNQQLSNDDANKLREKLDELGILDENPESLLDKAGVLFEILKFLRTDNENTLKEKFYGPQENAETLRQFMEKATELGIPLNNINIEDTIKVLWELRQNGIAQNIINEEEVTPTAAGGTEAVLGNEDSSSEEVTPVITPQPNENGGDRDELNKLRDIYIRG